MNYESRLSFVKRNKRFWKYWEVSERMKVKGVKHGFSQENIRTVLIKGTTKNEKVLTAAEEVIKIRQQVLLKDPIALKTVEGIIAEYNLKLDALKAAPLG